MKRGRKSKYIVEENADEFLSWNAGLYIRLSVEDDGEKEESDSIINQKILINEFLKDNKDIAVADMYIDDGYSGTNFNRPAINRLLNDMKLGKFNTIIVKDLSRFGRNYLEVGNYIEQIFPLFNIRFIAITDNIDSFRNPKSLQNIVVPFKNIINTEYSRDLSQKIKSSLDIKKRNGEFVGSFAPYGYIKDPDNKHHFIIDTYAAEIVDKIYDMILDGMGKPSICRKLHEMKILNPTAYKRDVLKMKYGKKGEIPKEYKTVWEISVIDKIIKDEVYCGDMIQGKRKHISYKNHKSVKNNKEDWIIVRNTHEAIIDRKKFTKVQEEIAKRNKNCSKSFGKEKNIFTGYLKCFDCEKSMRRLINKNTFSEKEYFICSTYSKIDKDFCTRHYIEKEKLEKILLSIIQIQIKLILEVDKLIIEIKSKNIIENDEKNLKAKIKCIENKIQNQNEYKKILYESWKLKKISKEKYHKLLEENQNDLLLDENKLIELEKNLLKINQMKNYDSAWISLFKQKQNIKELDKDVLEELIDTIYIHENNKITVKFKYEDEYKRTINLLKTVNEHHTGKEKQYEQKK